MKHIVLILILFGVIGIKAQENYLLSVNGESISIGLDSLKTISLKNGKELKLKLIKKDYLEYYDSFYSFKYPNGYSVTKTELEEGIEQIMVMSAEGNGVMVQKYPSINPQFAKEFLLSEITKESIGYGYSSKREDYSRKLKDGKEIEVLKAVLEYKDTKSIYEVASIGSKDAGIIIATMITDANFSNAKDLMDTFWSSMIYTKSD